MISIKKLKEDYLWALACASVLFLVFFRGRWALKAVNQYDDQCYLEWLHKFLFTPYPACYSSSHLPGGAILWIPVGWLSKLLSTLTSIPLAQWLEPLIGLQTFLTWAISLILLQKIILKFKVSSLQSKKIALVFLLNIPVLEFMTQFNFSTVAAELFLCCCLIYWVITKRWILAVLAGVLLNLTRLNDMVAFLVILGALIDSQKAKQLHFSEKTKRLLLLGFTILFGLATAYALFIGIFKGYNGLFLKDILPRLSPYRWWRGLFMGGWGLFWAAPAAILIFIFSLFFIKKLTWFSRAGLVWIFAEITLIIALNECRSDYTNPPWRYIIGSMIGMLPALLEISQFLLPKWRKLSGYAMAFLATWQVYLAFVTHSFTTLNYWKVTQWVDNWSLLHYVYILKNPLDLIKLLYLSPIGFTIFSWGADQPYFQRYAQYSKYALKGPALYLLTIGTIIALALLVLFVIKKIRDAATEVL